MNERPAETEDRFQQAKNPAQEPQLLQIVAKQERAGTRRKSQPKPEPKLTRVAFRVSRLMEFCTRARTREPDGTFALRMAARGRQRAGRQRPRRLRGGRGRAAITVAVEPGMIVVEDNGDGIDAETVASVLDYSVRVSSREAYCAPTRGAQGNALKDDPRHGLRDRPRDGRGDRGGRRDDHRGPGRHASDRVPCRPISNQPKIVHTTAPSESRPGPGSPSSGRLRPRC